MHVVWEMRGCGLAERPRSTLPAPFRSIPASAAQLQLRRPSFPFAPRNIHNLPDKHPVGVAPVDGQLERPALAVPVILIDRKRLLLAVREKAQGGLAFRTVGQGECHEGRQESTRRSPPCICRSAVRTTGTTSAGQEDAVAAAARLQTVGTGQPMRHRAGLTRTDPLTSADHAIQQPTCGREGICPSSVHAPLSPGPDPH